ncbi:MAG: hypothetical protein AB2L24_04305 [Mangrovibacterium sp.]
MKKQENRNLTSFADHLDQQYGKRGTNRIDFVKLNKTFWIITWSKYKKRLINYSIFSIVILALGLITKSDNEPSNPYYIYWDWTLNTINIYGIDDVYFLEYI